MPPALCIGHQIKFVVQLMADLDGCPLRGFGVSRSRVMDLKRPLAVIVKGERQVDNTSTAWPRTNAFQGYLLEIGPSLFLASQCHCPFVGFEWIARGSAQLPRPTRAAPMVLSGAPARALGLVTG
jgi:hypothetical protein